MTSDKINDLDKDILEIIVENKYITIPEISKAVGKSEPTVYRHLDNLMQISKIKRIGSRKTGYWKIIN